MGAHPPHWSARSHERPPCDASSAAPCPCCLPGNAVIITNRSRRRSVPPPPHAVPLTQASSTVVLAAQFDMFGAACRLCFSAVPDSSARADALRWITKRLAAIRLRQGALADAAAHYRQLLALDPAALTGEHDAKRGACALRCWPPRTSSLRLLGSTPPNMPTLRVHPTCTACADPGVLLKYAHLAAACDPSAAADLQQQIPASRSPTAAELDSLENANIGGRAALPALAQWAAAAVGGTRGPAEMQPAGLPWQHSSASTRDTEQMALRVFVHLQPSRAPGTRLQRMQSLCPPARSGRLQAASRRSASASANRGCPKGGWRRLFISACACFQPCQSAVQRGLV